MIELALYLLRKFSFQRDSAPVHAYLAYSVSPEVRPIAVQVLDAQNDEDALQKASPLFNDDLKRIEVWCGSRKVGDIPPKSCEKSDGEPIRDSA